MQAEERRVTSERSVGKEGRQHEAINVSFGIRKVKAEVSGAAPLLDSAVLRCLVPAIRCGACQAPG